MKRTSREIIICSLIGILFAMLVSCSAVFTSTINGTVQEEDGTSTVVVSSVDVYAYLSESERDSAVSLGDKPTTTVRIFHAISGTDGTYTMPVEWNSSSPVFGKTADRIPVYLAFFHKDFNNKRLSAAAKVSYLSSERTNTMETETLTRTSASYTLNLDIRNVALTTDYTISATNFTVVVKDDDGTILYSGTPTANSVTFSASTSASVSGTVLYTPNDSTAYVQCDADGTNNTEGPSAVDFSLSNKNDTTSASPCYEKYLVIPFVSINGYYVIIGSDDESRDGKAVTLLDGATVVGPRATTTYQADAVGIHHGYYSGLSTAQFTVVPSAYTTKIYSKEYTVQVEDGGTYYTSSVSVENDGTTSCVVYVYNT
ncbi:MAG: hypothetical protein WCR02_01540 [Sphaerochaetaceae bacterium]